MSENIEVAAEAAPPPKRTVREFLNQYRSLGLPGAKRFRRRTRLEDAKFRHEVDLAMIKGLIHRLAAFSAAFEKLKKEENWAVKDEDVVWIGESDPLEIIKEAERSMGD